MATVGTFLGIQEGIMSIEHDALLISDGTRRTERRIFSYPAGSHPHRDTFFRGGEPAVGQLVCYDTPSPDMAGHLVVDVMPVERFTGICRDVSRQVRQKTQLKPRRVGQILIEDVRSEDGAVARSHIWVDDWHDIRPGPMKFYGAVVGDGHIDFIEEVA